MANVTVRVAPGSNFESGLAVQVGVLLAAEDAHWLQWRRLPDCTSRAARVQRLPVTTSMIVGDTPRRSIMIAKPSSMPRMSTSGQSGALRRISLSGRPARRTRVIALSFIKRGDCTVRTVRQGGTPIPPPDNPSMRSRVRAVRDDHLCFTRLSHLVCLHDHFWFVVSAV